MESRRRFYLVGWLSTIGDALGSLSRNLPCVPFPCHYLHSTTLVLQTALVTRPSRSHENGKRLFLKRSQFTLAVPTKGNPSLLQAVTASIFYVLSIFITWILVHAHPVKWHLNLSPLPLITCL
jgi:hypothetical protein